MEKALAINAKMVQIGRAAQRVPMYLEAFQVRRSQAFGAQGHSGHETFPNVIRLVASGRLDLSPIITSRYGLEGTMDAIAKSTQRADGKILVKPGLD
jgi:threonine dehydrogenase-like Zn-dependent dehydrogenase